MTSPQDERRTWPDVATPPSLPTIDKDVRARWATRKVFEATQQERPGAPVWATYEGPPTANGIPGLHHLEARTFKDVFPRYRTMKGFHVPRRAGWDCHGLPVELEVERQLDLHSKVEIEAFGIEAFNQRCRDSVVRYVDSWKDVTERLGYWVDFDRAYWTMDSPYIESVWWALKEMHGKGLLFEDFRVAPYCGRCGTGLSDAEVAQGYEQVADKSVYVKFPIVSGPLADEGAALLVWTTTPWTLPANVAVAVNDEMEYQLVDADGGPLVVAASCVAQALGAEAKVIRSLSAAELVGVHYRAPFDFATTADERAASQFVVSAPFVTAGEGSGLVHIAPAFGIDDLALGRQHGLPVVNPVDRSARFAVGPWKGTFVKDADEAIEHALAAEGLLVRTQEYEHSYPFCWRCRTPLIYYAKPSWYIRTTARREAMIANNASIDWHPAHVREGRFGNWLTANVDWAISRDRYWGTPLPFWRCDDCATVTVVGSRQELEQLAGRDLADLDLHRPHIDEVVLACPDCGGRAHRVTEVGDAWLDSGAMPFAQWGYPHRGQEEFAREYPAKFICEGIDQTRGWFYTLLAESTLLFDRASYESVLCLGHIVDEDGRKMSKSLGNIIDPIELLERFGADAVRWVMLGEGSAWGSRRVGPTVVDAVVRRVFGTLWNSHFFFCSYANVDRFDSGTEAPAVADRPLADQWLLAETADLVTVVDDALDGFDAAGACRRIEQYIDDLSNWYIRTNRRRFWKSDVGDADKQAAYHTLLSSLVTLAQVMAPLTPFVADELWEDLVRSQDQSAAPSVHLTEFPAVDPAWVNEELREAVRLARRVVEAGRQARSEAGVKNRQPLRRAIVSVPLKERTVARAVSELVGRELNIRDVTLHDELDAELVEHSLKPRFEVLGPRYGPSAGAVGTTLRTMASADVARLVAAWREGPATITVKGEEVEVADDVATVIETPRMGWYIGRSGDVQIALDTTLDDELLIEGAARELIRSINQHRKDAGLDLQDRIELVLDLPEEIRDRFEAAGWLQVVADEVLAREVHRWTVGDEDAVHVGLGPFGEAVFSIIR